MKTIRARFKKGTAVALTAALLAGLVPALPGTAVSVKAADNTTKSPSVSTYATKEQLMDGTFAPNSSGEATNIGKLVFGVVGVPPFGWAFVMPAAGAASGVGVTMSSTFSVPQ